MAALGLTYGMWHDLVPPGIEPRPPALGVWSLSHWTTREAAFFFFFLNIPSIRLLNVSQDIDVDDYLSSKLNSALHNKHQVYFQDFNVH